MIPWQARECQNYAKLQKQVNVMAQNVKASQEMQSTIQRENEQLRALLAINSVSEDQIKTFCSQYPYQSDKETLMVIPETEINHGHFLTTHPESQSSAWQHTSTTSDNCCGNTTLSFMKAEQVTQSQTPLGTQFWDMGEQFQSNQLALLTATGTTHNGETLIYAEPTLEGPEVEHRSPCSNCRVAKTKCDRNSPCGRCWMYSKECDYKRLYV